MATAVIAGADPDGPGEALENEGVTVARVAGIAPADSLSEAGIEDADLLVFTGMDDATATAMTKEQNLDVCIVIYVYDTLPGFTKGQVDLAIDPSLLVADVVAEELI